ncbi:hypothetical protein ACLB2K_009981 [Fragaria x ananassa]
MAASKASVMALMAVFVVVISLGIAQAAEAPAPSPVSPAASISPSFVSGLVAAAVALVFGSALRTMAGTKTPLMALVAVLIMVISLAGVAQAHEGHAHAPESATSPAASISPSFVSAFVAAAVALVSGSALMV